VVGVGTNEDVFGVGGGVAPIFVVVVAIVVVAIAVSVHVITSVFRGRLKSPNPVGTTMASVTVTVGVFTVESAAVNVKDSIEHGGIVCVLIALSTPRTIEAGENV
jgi:hypothetical protein